MKRMALLINTLFRVVGGNLKPSSLCSEIMRRKRALIAAVLVAAAVSFSLFALFAPIVPAQFTPVPNCQSILCSSISKPPLQGYGSLSYALFGFGTFSTGFMGSGLYYSTDLLN